MHERPRGDRACDERLGLKDYPDAIQGGGEQDPAIVHLEARVYLNGLARSAAVERPLQIGKTGPRDVAEAVMIYEILGRLRYAVFGKISC